MIRSKCPRCKARLKAPDSYVGQPAKCPKCGSMSRVPQVAPAAAAAGARPKAPARGPKGALGAELASIADEALGGKPAARKSASGLTAAVPAKQARAGLKAPARPTRAPARRRQSMVGLYITLAGLVAIIGLGYFLFSNFTARQRKEDSLAAVKTLIQQAETTFEQGEYDKAMELYQAAIDQVQVHKTRYSDSSLDERVAEIESFMAYTHAQRDVDGILQKAKAAQKQQQYQVAQSFYQQVESAAKRYHDESTDKRVREKMVEYQRLAKEALASDEITMGAQNLVQYDGQWVTPEVRTRMVMAKRSMAYFEGEWRKISDIEKIKAQRAAAKAAKAKAAKAKTTQVAKAKAKAPAKRPKRPARPKAPAMDPNQDVWMFDDFEHGKILWRVQSWACPGELSLNKRGKTTELKLAYTRTGGDKCAVQRGIPVSWPFESRDELVLDANNEGKASFQLSIAFFTNQGRGFYETTGKNIRTGAQKDLVFDLRSKRFKCAETGWAHKAPLNGPEAVSAVVLMIYPRSAGVVSFDNVRFTKKGKK